MDYRSDDLDEEVGDPVAEGGGEAGHREGEDPGGDDRPATPQRTAERRLVAPTPMIAEVMVCVVEIGAWKTNAVV